MAKPRKPTKAALEAYDQVVEFSKVLSSLSEKDAGSLNDLIQRVHFTVMCDNDFMELDRWINLNQLDLFDGIRGFLHSEHGIEALSSDGIEERYRPEMNEREKSEK